MTISAKQVMELRAATGMPMMKCKQALQAEEGDYEKAVERLRKEGMKVAEARADRTTGEGLVRCRVTERGDHGVLVAVACETEPVSKTPLFTEFVGRLLEHVGRGQATDASSLLGEPWIDDPGQSVDEALRGLIAQIREKIEIQEIARLRVDGPGVVGFYVHHTGKDGALVSLRAENDPADLEALAKRLCMHIVFAKPTGLAREEIPDDLRTRELNIARAQVEQDPKMAKKPPQVLEKIVEGKLGAFYKQSVLTEQEWAVEPGSGKTVGDVLREHGATVLAFRRAHLGA